MHGISAITGNMHRSLRYFVLLERITSKYYLLHESECDIAKYFMEHANLLVSENKT